MRHIIYIGLILLVSLSSYAQNDNATGEMTRDYYRVYNDRQDFEKFLSFYADDIVLEDMVNGDRIEGIKNLRAFFDWPNPNYENSEENVVVIIDQIIEGNKSVVRGYFTPFKWGTTTVEAMHFTTILIWNDAGKIVKHIDWINYPAYVVDYDTRKNSNDWIKKL